jgi:hypothetical protein
MRKVNAPRRWRVASKNQGAGCWEEVTGDRRQKSGVRIKNTGRESWKGAPVASNEMEGIRKQELGPFSIFHFRISNYHSPVSIFHFRMSSFQLPFSSFQIPSSPSAKRGGSYLLEMQGLPEMLMKTTERKLP